VEEHRDALGYDNTQAGKAYHWGKFVAIINFCDGEWARSADVTADTQKIYVTKKRLKRLDAASIFV